MKKFVSVLLIICLILGLCGCHPGMPGVPTEYGKEPAADENDIPGRPKEDFDGAVLDDSHCAAPTYMQEIPYLAKYVSTEGGKEGMEFPAVVLIYSVEQLEQYIEENRAYFDLESTDSPIADAEPGFMDFCIFYDEAFFEKQYLVMVLVEESSDAMCHKVNHVGISGDGQLHVNLQTQKSDVQFDGTSQWHILIELGREYDVKYAENVRLGGRNYGEKHTLELAGSSEFILDTIPKIYNAGEIVRIRTEILLDADIVLYLNGVRLDRPIEVGIAPEGSTEDITCWEFAFVMPDEDSTLLLQVESGEVEPYYNLTYYCPELGEGSPILFLSQQSGSFGMTRTMFTSSYYQMGSFTWEDDRLILEEDMYADKEFRLVFALDGKDLIFRAEESWNYPEPFVDGMILQLWPEREEDTPIGSVCPEPPEMKLVVGGNSTPGVLGEYVWTVYQGDTVQTFESDFDMLMLMIAGAVPKFEVYEGIGTVCFASDMPDEISVRRWTAGSGVDLESYTNVSVLVDTFHLERGMHLYEVMATWERDGYTGTASYYFLVNYVLEISIQPDPNAGSGDDNDSTSDTRPGDNEFLCEVTRYYDGRVRYPAAADSEALRDFLYSLSYDSELCECMSEYKIDDGYGNQFEANLSEGYVRHNGQQAMLTEEQLELLYDLIA